ncbi:helix-hairpin-helix domain-containing protein [Asanoa sp. NPDC050611]|uniref:helix-hairpin-helix domain-containing protein n=1 Tax=Asanoa sp. NPDC050611 TaxID=3157098 RepID=UPI003407EC7A
MFPILGFGCLGSAALIVIGFVMGRRSVWISGIVYLAVSVPVFIVVGESDENTALSNWSVGALIAVWLVTIVHAFVVNAGWLRARSDDDPWPEPAAPPPGYPTTAPAALVDVNSADAGQLAALPHFDHARAARAIAERDRRGGFTDVFDFSDALGLAPHEYVQVLPLVVANPVLPPVPPPPPPPPPGPAGHPGRIVDV